MNPEHREAAVILGRLDLSLGVYVRVEGVVLFKTLGFLAHGLSFPAAPTPPQPPSSNRA